MGQPCYKIWIVQLVGLGRIVSLLGTVAWLQECYLFINLNRVKSGDIVILTLGDKKLAYQICMTRVVQPADFQVLQRQPQQDLLTLVTCTPYMINSHRLLVTGRRVPYQPSFQKKITQTIQSENLKQAGILLVIGVALGGQICWFWWRWRRSA